MWRQFKVIDADAHIHERNISGTDMWNRNTGRRILWGQCRQALRVADIELTQISAWLMASSTLP